MASDMNDYFNKKKSQTNSTHNSGGTGGGMMPPKIDFNPASAKMILLYFIIGLVVLLLIAKPFVIVNEGERGILATNGKYQEQTLLPGLHFIVPVIQKVYMVDTRVQIINYASGVEQDTGIGIKNKPAINVLDRRGLPVAIELTVQYRLNARFAAQTISNWGFSWEEKIINPVVRDVVRNVIGKYDAESLPNERNAIASQIEIGIKDSMKGLQNSPAILQSVQLREIVLPPKVKEQIERVQIAKQEVQRAEQEVSRAKQEALKRAATAQGLADAVKIEAQGKAQAIEIEAHAHAKANALIARSLTTKLLELEQLKVQGKFNEALKADKNAKIFLMPGGSTPNVWLDMKDDTKKATTTAH
jgi:regulator of protease activity HflC (stomatin/prohibitin superfamily)